MTKTEQKELATARAVARFAPSAAARMLAVMDRCTRRNATRVAVELAIVELDLRSYLRTVNGCLVHIDE